MADRNRISKNENVDCGIRFTGDYRFLSERLEIIYYVVFVFIGPNFNRLDQGDFKGFRMFSLQSFLQLVDDFAARISLVLPICTGFLFICLIYYTH